MKKFYHLIPFQILAALIFTAMFAHYLIYASEQFEQMSLSNEQ